MNKVDMIIEFKKRNKLILKELDLLKVETRVLFDNITYEITEKIPYFLYLMPVEYHLQKYFEKEQKRFGFQDSFRGYGDWVYRCSIYYDMIVGKVFFHIPHEQPVELESIPLQYNVPEQLYLSGNDVLRYQ